MKTLIALAALAFAGCAPVEEQESVAPVAGGRATARFGEIARIGTVTVAPLRVEEESRCPASVQCVHAGTVRLAVRAEGPRGAREVVLRLDEPREVWPGTWLELSAACPHPQYPGTIARETYLFFFSVAPAGPPPPLDFACPRAP